MKHEERLFVDELNKISESARKTILKAKDLPYDIAFRNIGLLQAAYIQYGEMLETHNEWIRSTLSKQIMEHARLAMEDNIKKFSTAVAICEEICESLYVLAKAYRTDFDAKVEEYKKLEGRLALFMRYEILSDYDDESNNKGIDRAADILQETGKITGDDYYIRILVNHVCRHFLPEYRDDDTAIVFQGQIKYEDDFTLETLYRYRKLYPFIKLIVSTWKDEVDDRFRWCAETIDVDILENEYPAESSRYHLNYQLHSSREGIRYAKSKYRIRYAMKTRTDQRFFMPDFIRYFKNEIKLFPPAITDKAKERIIFSGVFASMLSYPFRISDFWAFGTVDELIRLYSAPYPEDKGGDAHKKMWDDMPLENEQIVDNMTVEERFDRAMEHEGLFDSESYIIRSYYEDYILGRHLDPDRDDIFAHYWNFLRNHIIIEDPEMLLMYWPKYNCARYLFDSSTYEGALTHSTWVNLLLRTSGF